MLHGGDAWCCMVLHAVAWGCCMRVMHGGGAWGWCMVVVHGGGAWWCMVVHGVAWW